MRWWMTIDTPCIMSVDNASVTGMDFSELIIDNPDLWMVNWTDGKGEIENQLVVDGGRGDQNLNGLREAFIDVTPYVPLFQQFLWKMKAKNLLLNQAKKVQIELIHELFNSKRQLPYHHPIAAGDFWWDASDETMGASTSLGTQNVTAAVNQMTLALNQLVANINALIVDVTNVGISAIGNEVVRQVNANVVNYTNINIVNGYNANAASLQSEVSSNISSPGSALAAHLDNTVLGSWAGGSPSTTVNYGLRSIFHPAPDPGFSAAGGIGADIAHSGIAFGGITAYSLSYIPAIAPGAFSNLTHMPWTNLGNVSTSNVQWIPWGSTTPVTVTPAEQTAIMNGIATRTNELNLAKNTKIAEVMALTTVDSVIAYDVLAGWPAIDLPPGYPGSVLIVTPGTSASVAIVFAEGGGTGGGDFPEAPVDNITYGRRNMTWNPALALSGDVLDGGNF